MPMTPTEINAANPERKMPSTRSLELAAQAWCTPDTEHHEPDSPLMTAFAEILDRELERPALPDGGLPEGCQETAFFSRQWGLSSVATRAPYVSTPIEIHPVGTRAALQKQGE